jgi:Family of unknown function (DUF6152)
VLESALKSAISHRQPEVSMKLLGSLMIALCLLLPAAPSLAHHSFAAEFDANNCKEFTGTLTKIDWQNPHGYFYMDIKDANSITSVKKYG